MSEDSVDLNGLEIKPYISSQRNCRPAASGYVMEPLNSNLIIDLNHFPGEIKVTIIFKRISGNGKLKINNLDIEVLSKESHILDLNIVADKKIKIFREDNSIGKVILLAIKIIKIEIIDKNVIQKQLNNLKNLNENWRSLLIKFGNVRGIKLVNNKLYASEGAQIQHANIIELIETDPSQSFTTSDVIKFVFPCEIKSLYFKAEFQANISENESKYKHFTTPPNIKSNNFIEHNTINKLSNTVNNMTSSNNIIYDSIVSGLDPALLKNSKDIVGSQGKNNNGLLLKREAEFSIPINDLKSHMQYVVVVNLRKINGNGKFGLAFETTDGEPRSSTIVIAPDRETELYIKLNTDAQPSIGNSYVLKIFRPSDSTVGDVLLERLMIVNGISLAKTYVHNNLIQPSNTNKISRTYDLDSVRALSKQYSRRANHTKTEPKFNYSGTICLKNTSAINWLNKIKPLCHNIKIKNDANVVLGELGSLSLAEKIWVDPFIGEIISEQDNLILSKAKVLISPSIKNAELFKKLYPNIKIHCLERAWPLIEATNIKYPNGEYVVMIHRSKEMTDKVVEAYNKNNPPLVIIGALDSYPDFVIPMNEYVSYDKMLGVLFNSKLLIDLNNIEYNSAILSIARDCGLPIISLNKNDDIKSSIEDGLKLVRTNVISDHNLKLDKFLSVLFGDVE